MFSNEIDFSSRSSSREKKKEYDPRKMILKTKKIFEMGQFRKDKNMSALFADSTVNHGSSRPKTRMESNGMFSELRFLQQVSN